MPMNRNIVATKSNTNNKPRRGLTITVTKEVCIQLGGTSYSIITSSCTCATIVSEFIYKPGYDTAKLLILTTILTAALAAPQSNPADRDAVILKSDFENIGIDGFNWAYETSNGISASEQGTLQNAGSENEIMSVRGQFSYVGPDGVTYTVTYIADENGFQPQGAHIPKAP